MSSADQTRWCPHCEEHKPFREFYFRKGKPAGYCKPCAKASALESQQRRREKVVGVEKAEELRFRAAKAKKMKEIDSELDGARICRECGFIKPLEEYYGKGKDVDTYCKECRLEYDKRRLGKSPSHRLMSLLGASRTRARNAGMDFDLTKEFLVRLWYRQKGLCHYTSRKMTFDGRRKPEAVSIDRVDSRKGYTKDNVVLCCRVVNEMKSNMSVDDLLEMCSTILEVHNQRQEVRKHG